LRLESTAAFDRALRRLAEKDLARIADALDHIVRAFGNPHEHHGLRKLRGRIYEFRVGIDLRIVFRREPDTLFLLLLGSHDEIRRFLKKL